MASPLFASPTLSDAATFTASDSASSSLGVSRLQTLNPREYWRSSSTSPNIVIDLGSAADIRYVGALYGNWETSDTWRVRAATTEANLTASPGYDSGTVSVWPGSSDLSSWDRNHARLYFSSANAKTFRWWRIDFDVSSNTDGYAEFARLYLAEGIELDIGITYQDLWTPTFLSSVIYTTAHSGSVTPRAIAQRRPVSLPLRHLTKTEAFGKMGKLLRERGGSGDIVALIDPEEGTYPMEYTYYGLIQAEVQMPNTYMASNGSGGSEPRFGLDLELREP